MPTTSRPGAPTSTSSTRPRVPIHPDPIAPGSSLPTQCPLSRQFVAPEAVMKLR
ncbi:hypothetical protein BDN72DRAFT_838119, partial [Pluteus cervinus]